MALGCRQGHMHKRSMLETGTARTLGGIANFTDVTATFRGIIDVLEEHSEAIRAAGITIQVRRGGPNYQQALAEITTAGQRLGLDMSVHGPDVPMCHIVPNAPRLRYVRGSSRTSWARLPPRDTSWSLVSW